MEKSLRDSKGVEEVVAVDDRRSDVTESCMYIVKIIYTTHFMF